MLHANGFCAWIEIDGAIATEYNIEVYEAHRTVICWIPSAVGKAMFSVGWRNTGMSTVTAGHVFMDGTDCGGRVLYGPSTISAVHTGVTDGTSVRQFTFSSLTLTDDDAFLGHSENQDRLGVIEVVICPIQVIGTVSRPTVPVGPLSDIKVHERCKTSVTSKSNWLSLDSSRLLKLPSLTVLSARPSSDSPSDIVRSVRPTHILQANGIAPLPPQLKRKYPVEIEIPGVPTPGDDDPSDAEIHALRAKLSALEAKRALKGKKVRVKEEENIPPVQEGSSHKKARLDGGRRPAGRF